MTRHLERNYGLTQEDYDSQAASQNFLCAVCREANPHGKPLGVDHNHVTGANRELLCDRCNKILGFARDNRALLESLRAYLLKHDGAGEPFVPDNPETRAARDAAFEKSLSLSEQPLPALLSLPHCLKPGHIHDYASGPDCNNPDWEPLPPLSLPELLWQPNVHYCRLGLSIDDKGTLNGTLPDGGSEVPKNAF